MKMREAFLSISATLWVSTAIFSTRAVLLWYVFGGCGRLTAFLSAFFKAFTTRGLQNGVQMVQIIVQMFQPPYPALLRALI